MSKRIEVISRHLMPQETAAFEPAAHHTVIDRKRLAMLLEKEEELFIERTKKSYVSTSSRNVSKFSRTF